MLLRPKLQSLPLARAWNGVPSRLATFAQPRAAAATAALCSAAAAATVPNVLCQPDKDNNHTAFALDKPSKFDLSSYLGRVAHFIDSLGDLTTLLTTKADVERCTRLLEDFKYNECTADDATLWRARKVLNATCHPETGEMIPAPFRFSAFAPANLIICAGMLRPNPTLLQSAFWQWMNQSYNACVNYCNRSSPSEDGGISEFVFGYVAATASALAVVLGLQEGARKLLGGTARIAGLVRLTVPMLAVSISANVNLFLMRANELSQGVPVTDDSTGQVLGSSVVAAKLGLYECALTRVLWTFMLLTATPIATSFILPVKLGSVSRLCAELLVSFGIIWISVPVAIATFPQRELIHVSDLEDELRERWAAMHSHEMCESKSQLSFNRGL